QGRLALCTSHPDVERIPRGARATAGKHPIIVPVRVPHLHAEPLDRYVEGYRYGRRHSRPRPTLELVPSSTDVVRTDTHLHITVLSRSPDFALLRHQHARHGPGSCNPRAIHGHEPTPHSRDSERGTDSRHKLIV